MSRLNLDKELDKERIEKINKLKKKLRYKNACDILKEDGLLLEYIENPTTIMKFFAIKNNPKAIFLIENPTEEMILEALSRDFCEMDEELFSLFLKLSEENKNKAIKKNGLLIKYVENPPDEIKDLAIKSNGWSILFIEDLTKELITEGINNAYKHLTIDGIDYYPEEIATILNVESEISMDIPILVRDTFEDIGCSSRSPFAYIKNPSDEFILKNLIYGDIENIENPSEEVQMFAVKKHMSNINYIHNPSEKVKEYVVSKKPEYIKKLKNPSEKIKEIAFKKKPTIADEIRKDYKLDYKEFNFSKEQLEKSKKINCIKEVAFYIIVFVIAITFILIDINLSLSLK